MRRVLEISGYREALEGMLRIVVTIPSATQEALEETAEEIVADAKRIVPVRTGRLRDSIGVAEIKEDSVEIKTIASYAGALEFGNSRMLARPYLRPAIQHNLIKFLETFIRSFRI